MRFVKVVLSMLLLAALAGCSKPLPPEKSSYAGQWSGQQVQLLITQDGRVEYSKVDANSDNSIKAPIKEFAGANFVVGVGPMATTFVVSVPPHQDGDTWKMTVDGIELTRQ
jgi:hypothetical protein